MNLWFTTESFLVFIGGLIVLGFLCLLVELERAPIVDEDAELPPAPSTLPEKMLAKNKIVRSQLLPPCS